MDDEIAAMFRRWESGANQASWSEPERAVVLQCLQEAAKAWDMAPGTRFLHHFHHAFYHTALPDIRDGDMATRPAGMIMDMLLHLFRDEPPKATTPADCDVAFWKGRLDRLMAAFAAIRVPVYDPVTVDECLAESDGGALLLGRLRDQTMQS